MGYLYIVGTLLFTVYGQIVLKWRMTQLSFKLPNKATYAIFELIKIIFDSLIFSAFASAFIASLFWMAAMTKFDITKAYPFMSLAPALVFVVGIVLLGEAFTWGKLIGLTFIILGIIITVKL